MSSGSYRNSLYTSIQAGTAKNTFAAETCLNLPGDAMKSQANIPANFFGPGPADAYARGLYIRAAGIFSTTVAPNLQLNVRAGASGNVASQPILLGMPAVKATISGAANNAWVLEGVVHLEALGSGPLSTIRGVGVVMSSGLAVPVADLFGGGVQPGTNAVFDATTVNYINVNAIWGTSNALNTIQLLQLDVESLN